MKRFVILLALMAGYQISSTAQPVGTLLHHPQTALFELDVPGAWSAGLRYEQGRRELRSGGTTSKLDSRHASVSLTFSPASWLALSAGAGAAEAKFRGTRGEYGLDWQLAARLGLLEHVLHHSPVRGRTRLLRLDAGADFRRAESNSSAADFNWQEWRFQPSVTYVQSMPPHMGYRLLHPESAALHAGLVFSHLRGSHGGNTWNENRNFGLRLGTGVRLVEGWAVFADAVWFRADELTFAAGMTRQF